MNQDVLPSNSYASNWKSSWKTTVPKRCLPGSHQEHICPSRLESTIDLFTNCKAMDVPEGKRQGGGEGGRNYKDLLASIHAGYLKSLKKSWLCCALESVSKAPRFSPTTQF